MKRAEGLVSLSRRELCGGVAACLGLATIAGCVDGDLAPVSTGPLTGPGQEHPPDASPPDTVIVASCPASGVSDVGTATTFVANTPVYFTAGNFFVVRDAGGLYAVTARCTHEGYTCIAEAGKFHCKKHDAFFDYNGGIITGPVVVGLVHYAMCTLANGHVGVIAAQTVPKTQRLVA